MNEHKEMHAVNDMSEFDALIAKVSGLSVVDREKVAIFVQGFLARGEVPAH